MKAKLMLLPFFFVLFFYDTSDAAYQVDSALVQQREYYMGKYRSVRDTMTVNSWINLKRLSDNLEKLAATDAQIIDSLVSRIQADSVVISEMSSSQDQTNVDEPMQSVAYQDAGNNRMMLMLLKAFLAFLLLVLLILVYFLVRRSKRLSLLSEEFVRIEALATEKQSQATAVELELNKLKQRELGFREELERGIQVNQERMRAMQQKCELLEEDNKMLAGRLKSQDSQLKAGTPEDAVSIGDDEKSSLIRSLTEERSSLMNLAATLRAQLADETRKRQNLLEKFRSVFSDLNSGTSE